jgi:hypothetical protein
LGVSRLLAQPRPQQGHRLGHRSAIGGVEGGAIFRKSPHVPTP